MIVVRKIFGPKPSSQNFNLSIDYNTRMKLILGLGNVGTQYAHTRHNIGFMVIDELAHWLHAGPWRAEAKFKAEVTRGGHMFPDVPADHIILAKPGTMMNLSGEAAQKLIQFYKIAPADVWAIFDDVDVPFGRLRVRAGGGSGGHQGIKSLIQHIGPDFVRVRVGISLNDRTREPSEVYVLKPFDPEEREHLPLVLKHTAEILTEQFQGNLPTETTFDFLA
jgi:peptidyl-tRNA hydrolase, PTH1 family